MFSESVRTELDRKRREYSSLGQLPNIKTHEVTIKMHKLFLTLVALIALVSAANAEVKFYNATNREFTVNVTLPNGNVETGKLHVGSSTATHQTFGFDYRIKTVTYEVFDDMGASVGKGTADAQDSTFLVYSVGGATKVVPSGFGSGDGYLAASLVANLTGEQGTFDFIGSDGLDAQRGISLPTTFDAQKPFRFHSDERKYTVKFNSANGQVHEMEQGLEKGHYYAIHYGPNGKVVLSYLGYIKK